MVFLSILIRMVVWGICIRDKIFFCMCVLLVVVNVMNGNFCLRVVFVVLMKFFLVVIFSEFFMNLKFWIRVIILSFFSLLIEVIIVFLWWDLLCVFLRWFVYFFLFLNLRGLMGIFGKFRILYLFLLKIIDKCCFGDMCIWWE